MVKLIAKIVFICPSITFYFIKTKLHTINVIITYNIKKKSNENLKKTYYSVCSLLISSYCTLFTILPLSGPDEISILTQ